MADIRASKNGNWSDATVWTPNPPAAGDIVRPNNFTVTVDVSFSVTEIRNDAGGGATAGGSFTLTDGVVATASNGFFGTYLGAAIGLLNYGGAGTVTLNGNLDGSRSAVTDTCCVSNNSSGTIIINGNLTSAGSGSTSQTVRNQSTGRLIITGNLTSIGGTLVRNNAGTTTINGNIASNSGTAIQNTSGTVTITGNCTCNEGTILTNVSGIVTITGDVAQNSTGSVRIAISNTGSGTINIIGNISGAAGILNSNTRAVVNSANGIVNITGIISCGTANQSNTLNQVIDNTSSGTINITGTINGTSLSASTTGSVNGVRNSGTGTINFTGNVNGNSGLLIINSALFNSSSGTINVSGNAIGGSNGLAIGNNSTGTINLNGNAIGGTSYAAVENTLSSGNLIVEKIVFGANGQTATRGYIKFKNTVNIAAETVLKTDATTTNLVDINVVPNLQPSISDVRLGVTYSSGSLTGTMNVPPFNAVKAGVPVDNGVGTAALTPQDVWNVLMSGITQSGSIGERLKIVSTIETTGTQLASFNV